MNDTTRREALVAFGTAIDKLRQKGAPVTEANVEVLKLYFLSGVQWGLDHKFMERSQIISPFN
jgi:hypothetical protein